MAGENNESFRIDLDVKDAVLGADELRKKISEVGSSESISKLINGLSMLTGPLAVAAAAMYVLKKAFDLTLEGEQIQKIERNFDSLAETFGVSSENIKRGIEKATSGFVDMTDALKASSDAMVKLGSNSSKIPQLLDLSRRASKVMGVDMLEAFNDISTAVATGNTRSLKRLGIIIDSQKAEEKYAKQIGITATSLSEQGKQNAILNAVMEQGNAKFKSVGDSGETLGKLMREAGLAIKDLYESLAVAISNSTTMKSVISGLGTAFRTAAGFMRDHFGSELDQTKYKLRGLTEEYTELEKKLAARKAGLTNFFDRAFGESDDQIKEKIAKVRAEMATLTTKTEKIETKDESKGGKEKPGPSPQDLEKAKLENAKFNRELLQLNDSRIRAQLEIEGNASAASELYDQQILNRKKEFQAKMAELDAQAKDNPENMKRVAAEKIQIEQEMEATLKQMETNRDEVVSKSYDVKLKKAKTVSDAIVALSEKEADQQKKIGEKGTFAYGLMKTASANFFKTLGTSSESAAEQMKKAMFGFLGEYAMHSGEVMLAEGIGDAFGGKPGAAGKIAQGGALITLGSFISSMGGGGGGSSGATGGSGGGGGGGASTGSLETPSLSEQQKKSVTIQVQGSYFETEQTNTRLLEMMRQASDATDFKYQQIGVK